MNQQFRSTLVDTSVDRERAGNFPGSGDPGALEALIDGRASTPETSFAHRSSTGGYGEAALIEAYRQRGFLRANLDPLGLTTIPDVPELDVREYGVAADSRLVARLKASYCATIGWEFGHIHDSDRRRWLAAEAENGRPELSLAKRAQLLTLLTRTAVFETALAHRLPGAKLFGIGGAETFNIAIETMFAEAARLGVEEVVIGGMHRGRFNLLANVCGKPLGSLIAEIIGRPAVPEGLGVSSDVSYHLGYSGDRDVAGRRLIVSVSPHPSHLQLIPIISQGRSRAKQRLRGGDGRRLVLPLLLHTDASFAGQGLVAEMFQMSSLAPYDIGGTIHIVINNQLGFTTAAGDGRSARACTDIARLVEAPILHVNGDDPEAVDRVAQVAANYRSTFGRDIVIDLVCYRRPGHNEIDEPRFTQPAMYRAIDHLPPVHLRYARATDGGVAEPQAQMEAEVRSAFEIAKTYAVNGADRFDGVWSGLHAGSVAEMVAEVATGLPTDELRRLGSLITEQPAGFAIYPKVIKFLAERRRTIDSGDGITWATAETLGVASLLAEGIPVRFSGQDMLRGAFTQRHWQLHDQTTGAEHLVLAPAALAGTRHEFYNTPLIEHGVLCFEYGITLSDPNQLTIWEAQFGEFLNIGQAVFDQCIACGEDRWLRSSGLVILLPHGLDGGGPDHSTARPERLLAACAGANLQVVNASTPANFFHVLRRQMKRPFRKPLVVLTPKALLRQKACVSALAEFGPGTCFRAIILDDAVAKPKRIILCTGKVYYALHAERMRRRLEDIVALVRIEQLHPLAEDALSGALVAHPDAEIIWCEEEPENMGYYTHLRHHFERLAGRPVKRVGRAAAATPAVGVKAWLEAEEVAFLKAAFH